MQDRYRRETRAMAALLSLTTAITKVQKSSLEGDHCHVGGTWMSPTNPVKPPANTDSKHS